MSTNTFPSNFESLNTPEKQESVAESYNQLIQKSMYYDEETKRIIDFTEIDPYEEDEAKSTKKQKRSPCENDEADDGLLEILDVFNEKNGYGYVYVDNQFEANSYMESITTLQTPEDMDLELKILFSRLAEHHAILREDQLVPGLIFFDGENYVSIYRYHKNELASELKSILLAYIEKMPHSHKGLLKGDVYVDEDEGLYCFITVV